MDYRKCADLKKELKSQPKPQLIPIARFFDGNDDEGSIGCNLFPHPGIAAFSEALTGLVRRSDVKAVYALITELDPGEDSWPFSDTVVVVGTIDSESLQAALADLQPDEIGPADPDAIGASLSESDRNAAQIVWWD